MSEAPSIRDTLKAAMTGGEAPEVPEVAAPEVVDTAAAAPEAPEASVEAKTPGAPERDEGGRFKPKEQTSAPSADAPPAAETKIETAQPAETDAPKEPTRIPPSLPAAVKAQWAELKPEVQQAFHKLEDSVQTAKAEWGRKGERLNRYDEIMAPRNEKLQLQGIDEFTAIKTLFAAQDLLERDPLGGIKYLAQSYGVTPQHLAQAYGLTQANGSQPGAEGQPAPTAQPDLSAALQPFMQRVQTLEQQIEQQGLAEAYAAVEAFKNDPANMYFDNVREDIKELLGSGRAKSLSDAYQKAIWSSDEIRPLLIAAQTAEATKAASEATAKKAQEEAQRKKATQAAQAAGSVTGAPAPGAAAPGPGSSGNLRDDLLAAKRLVESRA